MYTVKVRDKAAGTEVLFDATQVVKFVSRVNGTGDAPAHDAGEIRCDVETIRGIETVTYPVRGCAPADGSGDITMFVMNRSGATVATYHL